MRALLVYVLGLTMLVVAVVRAQNPPPKVGALPPHPLDGAFERGRNNNDLTNGLLNNPAFKRAVDAAAKAKLAQEKAFRDNPNLKAATPPQAARQAFLKALNEPEAPGGVGQAPPKDAPK